MIRQQFVHRIEGLREDVFQLGELVEQSLTRAVNSLHKNDTTTASWVIENDARIDESRRTLEERVVAFFATQQPVVAHDLRLVAVIGAIASELERIGDYASGIARRVQRNPQGLDGIAWSEKLEQMTDLARQMLHTSLEAFLQQDVDMARGLGQTDEEVDALRDQLREEMIAFARNDVQHMETIVDTLDIIRAVERAADRATNIGERVIYIATSEVEEINP